MEFDKIYLSAIQRALSIDEIVFEIGKNIGRIKDLSSASSCCKIWRKVLSLLLVKNADVYMEDDTSFIEFLNSECSVVRGCRALRVSIGVI